VGYAAEVVESAHQSRLLPRLLDAAAAPDDMRREVRSIGNSPKRRWIVLFRNVVGSVAPCVAAAMIVLGAVPGFNPCKQMDRLIGQCEVIAKSNQGLTFDIMTDLSLLPAPKWRDNINTNLTQSKASRDDSSCDVLFVYNKVLINNRGNI
jgi:hypothetical protein